jgi:hypothetical protein
MLDFHDMGRVEMHMKAVQIPFNVGSIEGHIGIDVGWGGMRKSIVSITAIGPVGQIGDKSIKQTLNVLIDARRVRFCKMVKSRGSARGTVTAQARATGAIALNMILPDRTKDDNIGWARNRGAKHAEGVKLVQLFVLARHPEGPRVESFELAAGKG